MASKTLTVSTSQELQQAFERLAAGDGGTIRLEASSKPYDVQMTDRDRSQTDAPVRIVSADPGEPARIAEMKLVGRENVTIEGVLFDSSGTKQQNHHRDLEISHGTNIAVLDSAFRGGATETLDGSPGQVRGEAMALVRLSDGVTMKGLTVEGYYHGVGFFDSNDIVFADSEITRMQGDGIRIGGVQDALIEGNHLHGMLGTSQHINHSDMIQFWGTNIRQNTERVTIRDNVLNTSDGPSYQMIFGHNEHIAKNGFLFEDILIEGNLIHGAAHNMISVGDTKRMVVRDNTVLWNSDTHEALRGGGEGASQNGWIRAPNGHGTKIEGNLASSVHGATGPNGLVRYVDPTHPDYFDNNFVNLGAGETAELQDLSLLPGSQWDRKLGAPMTWSSNRTEETTAVVRTEHAGDDLSVVTLDASLSRDAKGRLGEAASYVWTFEDGTVKRGMRVTHDFETAGEHGYALEVSGRGGRDRIERQVEVEEPLLLDMDIRGGKVVDGSSYSTKLHVAGARFEDGGFVLTGSSRIEVDRYTAPIYSLDAFALSMHFEPASDGASGVLFSLPKAMQGSILSNGAFRFELETTEGRAVAITEAGAFEGTAERVIAVTYDGARTRVFIDGEEAASAPLTGITKPAEYWGLTIGNPWNPSIKGVVSDVRLSAELDVEGGPSLIKGDGASAGSGGGAVVGDGGSKPDPDEGSGGTEGGSDQGSGVKAGSDGGSGGGSGGGAKNGEAAIRLDFDQGVRDLAGSPAGLQWDQGEVRFVEGSDGTGRAIAVGGGEDAVTIGRGNAELFGLDAFEIAFDLKREGTGSDGGRVITLPRTLELKLSDDGRLAFELATDGGEATARTDGGVIGTGWHEVVLGYASGEGLTLVVDGEMEARAALSGTTAEASYWGLTLGRPWGGEADAFLDDFVLRTEAAPSGGGGSGGGSAGGGSAGGGGGSGRGGSTLVELDFEGDLRDADGRPVKARADGPLSYGAGSEGRGARIGEGDVLLARENAFLHERDSFEIAFDLKRGGPDENGRVIHFNEVMDAWVSEAGVMAFSLRTDEGAFRLETGRGAISGGGWHEVEIGYDDAAQKLRLEVDGEAVEVRASGSTAGASHWGLTLGAAWGDALDATIDGFRMSDAPDWA